MRDNAKHIFQRQLSIVRQDNCSPEVLSELSGSSFSVVKRAVAGHANTPVPVLVNLLDEGNSTVSGVVWYLIKNPSFPDELVESRIAVIPELNEECRTAVIDRLMGTAKYVGYPREWVETQVFG